MKICIVRHGETDWNVQGRWQGHEDVPLNEKGREQAKNCGNALKAEKWSAIFTSPLSRARETAEIIAEILGITEIHAEEDLIERDFGAVSGLFPAERNARFPDGLCDDAEPCAPLRARMYSAVKKSADKMHPQNIIIVSHGSAINAFLAEVSNGEIGTGKTRLQNAGINMFSYEKRLLKLVFHNKNHEDFSRL